MATDTSTPRELRGILIDPHAREVREVRVAEGLDAYCALLGCTSLDVVSLGESVEEPDTEQDLWVDDSGFIVPWEEQGFFVLRSPEDRPPIYYARPPLAGKALLLGAIAGRTVSTGLDVEVVRESIHWLLPEQVVAPKPMVWQADEHMQRMEGTGQVLDGSEETTWDIHNQPSGVSKGGRP